MAESGKQDNVISFAGKEGVKHEAGAWVVRMAERPLDKAEEAELRAWMQRSDFHREYLLKLAANWDAMGVLKVLSDLFPLPEKESGKERAAPSLPKVWVPWRPAGSVAWRAAAAVVVAVACVLVLVAGRPGEEAVVQTYSTAVGERASYTLADGTTVTLNTGSAISVEYDAAQRTVRLPRGEASFRVTKQEERPFVVYAGGGMVQAIGTAFNVRNLTDAVDVIVTEGSVKVVHRVDRRDRGARTDASGARKAAGPSARGANAVDSTDEEGADGAVLLAAGQSLRYGQTSRSLQPVEIREQESARRLAWREGSLIFKGETLAQALSEISRYTEKKIIADPLIQDIRTGGHYKTDDIDSLLATLGQGLGLEVEYTDDDRILLSASAKP